MVSVCLPSDALSQHLPSYLGFSYLGHGVSLHGCSSKAQPLLLTLDEEYLLTAAPPDLERGVAPLSPPGPMQLPFHYLISSCLLLFTHILLNILFMISSCISNILSRILFLKVANCRFLNPKISDF